MLRARREARTRRWRWGGPPSPVVLPPPPPHLLQPSAAEPGAVVALPAAGRERGPPSAEGRRVLSPFPVPDRILAGELSVSLPEFKHEGECLNPAAGLNWEYSCRC